MKFLISVSTFAIASVIAGGAFAADLVVDNVAIDAASPATWEGAYIGAHAGFGAGTVNWETEFSTTGEYDLDGWALGGQIGYNWQIDNIVFGLEADLSLSDISGEDDAVLAARQVNWLASARGRVGFALDSVLLYGTAGLAVANSTGEFFFFDDTQTHVGWTVGLGAEVLVTDNVSLKAEYRYSDYGAETYDYTVFDVDTGFTTHTATVGVNFHF
jgi:opacity protein-like surface antigen